MINGTLTPSDIPPAHDFHAFLKVVDVLADPVRCRAMATVLQQNIKDAQEAAETAKKTIAELDTKRAQHEENMAVQKAAQENRLAADRRAFEEQCSARRSELDLRASQLKAGEESLEAAKHQNENLSAELAARTDLVKRAAGIGS